MMTIYDKYYSAETRIAVTESLERLKSLIAHYDEVGTFAPHIATMTPTEKKEFQDLLDTFDEKRREQTLSEIYTTAKEFISAYEAFKSNE